MSNPVAPPSPEINHLRAAVALIPVIESRLADSKLTPERASLMAAFCEWTTESAFDKPEAVKLAKDELERLKVALSVSATDSEQT